MCLFVEQQVGVVYLNLKCFSIMISNISEINFKACNLYNYETSQISYANTYTRKITQKDHNHNHDNN